MVIAMHIQYNSIMYVLQPFYRQSHISYALQLTIYKVGCMHTVYVCDLPLFVVCGTVKGQSNINIYFFISWTYSD